MMKKKQTTTKTFMLIAFMALASITASARPYYRHHHGYRHVSPCIVVVKKCGCPCKQHAKIVKIQKTTRMRG